ncbi:diacylglycerol kinase (ATP) [Halanaerobium saccharolyticum]|uniref:Diacylglycerol kinase (ATP) n=1 Tax=Halanaerobium saccharolyticum TaxID=43595 RepID=A0A4R6LM15_9FIRM|nr:diacylglycerol kinase [Halanaerobium saccharolyticum]TDO84481.1 diacylglycerol kinase (ATP) [Halanaerobium saccharolyticum]
MWILKTINSFNHAIAGFIHAIRTQRNMQIHLIAAIFVLAFSLFFDLSRLELGLIILSISLVLFAELVNTAVEVIIDILTQDYSFKARIAKNISAAAVVIAAGNAVFIAYLIFFNRAQELSLNLIFNIRHEPLHLIFINLSLIFILIIALKSIFSSGTPLKGGIVSGHSALAASAVLIIWFLTQSLIAFSLAAVLAFLTAQSRLEAGTHSFREILLGTILGIIITFIIFYYFSI